jgi:hypothetical protein
MQTLDPRLLDLFAVRWVVVPEARAQAGGRPAYRGPDGVVYENPRAMPRAWVTGKWETLPADGDCKARLLADDFDRRSVALLETAPAPRPDPDAAGTARVAAFTANRVALDVTASAPALVVLAEAWHPGWRARVNGAEAPVLPADCVLRAVPVPAGASRLELQFVDPALRTGRTVTFVALVGVVGLAAFGLRPGRRRRAQEAAP